MPVRDHQLDISAQDLSVIEGALQTQFKILNVQASAGGTAARDKLNAVKRVLAQVDAQKPVEKKPCTSRWSFCWGRKRIFG